MAFSWRSPLLVTAKLWWGARWTGPIGKLPEATGGLQRRHRVLCPWQPFFKRHQAHAAGVVEKYSMYKSVSSGVLQDQKHRIFPNDLDNVAGPLQLLRRYPRGNGREQDSPALRLVTQKVPNVRFNGPK